VDLNAYLNETNVQLIKIRNGWYEFIKQKQVLPKSVSVVALIAIKPEYDFENRYLNSKFSAWLKLPDNTKLITPVKYLNHTIKSKFGAPLFEIYRNDGLYSNNTINVFR